MTKNTLEETQLVREAKTDIYAFAKLYDIFYSPIYRYLLRRTADYDTACDLTSLTFVKALQSMKNYQERGIPFSAWLYKIATNEFNLYYRKQKIKKIISLDFNLFENFFKIDKDLEPETTEIEKENIQERHQSYCELHKQIMKLNLAQQEIITLRYFENKKIKEISQILTIPENTVKSHLHRALKQLNKKLSATKYELEH